MSLDRSAEDDMADDLPEPANSSAEWREPNPTAARPAAVKPNRERYDLEANWPADVWSIGINRMDLIGVDERGNLYWDGKRIEVSQPLTLTWWQKVGAIAVAVATTVAAGGTTMSAVADWRSMPAKQIANDRRCLAIQQDMLSAQPQRSDGPDLFQALVCQPKGEGGVHARPSQAMIEVHEWLPWGGVP